MLIMKAAPERSHPFLETEYGRPNTPHCTSPSPSSTLQGTQASGPGFTSLPLSLLISPNQRVSLSCGLLSFLACELHANGTSVSAVFCAFLSSLDGVKVQDSCNRWASLCFMRRSGYVVQTLPHVYSSTACWHWDCFQVLCIASRAAANTLCFLLCSCTFFCSDYFFLVQACVITMASLSHRLWICLLFVR